MVVLVIVAYLIASKSSADIRGAKTGSNDLVLVVARSHFGLRTK